MQVVAKLLGGAWALIPCDGKFEGECIGTVESIMLDDVSFRGAEVVGRPVAVWGAEFRDDVMGHAKTVGSLGIGGNFDTRVKSKIVFDGLKGSYVHKDTGYIICGARRVVIGRDGIFWR